MQLVLWVGAIGSALTGVSTVLVAIGAIIHGPKAVQAWRERQQAEGEVQREQAETIRLERRRCLSGWSAHGVATYGVTLVTAEDELNRAVRELVAREPTPYVVLRVAEGGGGDVNRALSLRGLIDHEGHVSRAPTVGETEALRKGLEAMDVPHASY